MSLFGVIFCFFVILLIDKPFCERHACCSLRPRATAPYDTREGLRAIVIALEHRRMPEVAAQFSDINSFIAGMHDILVARGNTELPFQRRVRYAVQVTAYLRSSLSEGQAEEISPAVVDRLTELLQYAASGYMCLVNQYMVRPHFLHGKGFTCFYYAGMADASSPLYTLDADTVIISDLHGPYKDAQARVDIFSRRSYAIDKWNVDKPTAYMEEERTHHYRIEEALMWDLELAGARDITPLTHVADGVWEMTCVWRHPLGTEARPRKIVYVETTLKGGYDEAIERMSQVPELARIVRRGFHAEFTKATMGILPMIKDLRHDGLAVTDVMLPQSFGLAEDRAVRVLTLLPMAHRIQELEHIADREIFGYSTAYLFTFVPFTGRWEDVHESS